MALTPGTRLGAFELIEPSGSEGKGEVYRARDTKLDRDVAISGESRSLPGTEDAAMLFWSPDSRDPGFFTGAALKRVSAAGGQCVSWSTRRSRSGIFPA